MRLSSRGWEDYTSWSDDRKALTRSNRLINEAERDPAVGTGKPERLKGDLVIIQARRHY